MRKMRIFDQISGKNSPGLRFRFTYRDSLTTKKTLWLPIEMKNLGWIRNLADGRDPRDVFDVESYSDAERTFALMRSHYDFPFWAATFYRVTNMKRNDLTIPLLLNKYQRKVADVMIRTHQLGLPERHIFTKCKREIGLTSVVEAYLFWRARYSRNGGDFWICSGNHHRMFESALTVLRFLRRTTHRRYPCGNWCDYFRDTLREKVIRREASLPMWITDSSKVRFMPIAFGSDGLWMDNLQFVHIADLSDYRDPKGIDTFQKISNMTPKNGGVLVMEGDSRSHNRYLRYRCVAGSIGGWKITTLH